MSNPRDDRDLIDLVKQAHDQHTGGRLPASLSHVTVDRLEQRRRWGLLPRLVGGAALAAASVAMVVVGLAAHRGAAHPAVALRHPDPSASGPASALASAAPTVTADPTAAPTAEPTLPPTPAPTSRPVTIVPVPTAAPTPKPAVELLADGGFEQATNCNLMQGCDPVVWIASAQARNPQSPSPYHPINGYPGQHFAYDGTYDVHLMVGDNGYSLQELHQTVRIPSGSSSVGLQFWASTQVGDVSAEADVTVTDAAGVTTPLVTLTRAQNGPYATSPDWRQYTADLTRFRGQTLTFSVAARLTGPYVDFTNAAFHFDDMSLTAR